ncbi:putative repeat protein (TIGR01451 family) [Paenibacillus cellulosilyticus]|uniref:Putative repeat protein (TIGR01451 family) n=1 Tax=Paenibacillus cellulosilyticus TaxID=375489 RepID=A0A2V2YUP3_9BACL|nr:DUF11 domain-containing protein [Paenibacillus cellulosilyticus]PWW04830.1 putative repeat protein (TIGR01451 family) [Paenibacillus cellulosilyticus]QKS45946.1 DUF11 domain-containing protein [Paenibacillus cellulosilyticus]
MTPGGARDNMLLNQTHVRFSSGALEMVSYSNIVRTPLVGPVLSAVKRAAPDQLVLGQSVTYMLTITNTGNLDAQVVVFDTLPEGLAFIPNSVLMNGAPLPGASPAAGITIGTAAVGSAKEIVFQAIVIALPQSFTFVNQAIIAYSFTTQDGRTVSDTIMSNLVSTPVTAFQLNAHGQMSSNVTFVGDILYYEIIITNAGLMLLEQLAVVIPLPEGFSFMQGSVVTNGILVPWVDPYQGIPVGMLEPGASSSVKVGVRLDHRRASPLDVFQAVVEYVVNGKLYRTPTNPIDVLIITPTLDIQLSEDRNQVTLGSPITYRLTVSNENSFAVDATVYDLIPPGTTYVPNSLLVDGIPRIGVSPTSGLSIGTIRAGTQSTITYQAVVNQSTTQAKEITAQARVIYTYRLKDTRVVADNIQSNAVVAYIYAPTIAIQASVHPLEYERNESVFFNVLITNTGNWAASVTLFRTPYPPGFQVRDVRINDVPAGAFTVENGLELGSLPPGSSVRVSYSVYVPAHLHDADDVDDWEVQDPEAPASITYVPTSYIARYRSQFQDEWYTGGVQSNVLIVHIDHLYE